jgi:hypothetical protein
MKRMDLQAFLGDGRVARDEWRGGYPTPPVFCKNVIRWELGGGGLQKM